MTKSYPYITIGGIKKRLHTHIMENFLGRPLEKNEHVYHKNGDRKDNSLENLVIVKKNMRKHHET